MWQFKTFSPESDTVNASITTPNDYDKFFSDSNTSDEISHCKTKDVSLNKENGLQGSFDGGFNTIKAIKLKNIYPISVGQININSLRNKFEFLNEFVKGYIDILLVTETKIDDSFPISQFCIEGFSTPFRLDRNAHGGGILLYVRADIPAKLIRSTKFEKHIEALFIEINLRKKKGF